MFLTPLLVIRLRAHGLRFLKTLEFFLERFELLLNTLLTLFNAFAFVVKKARTLQPLLKMFAFPLKGLQFLLNTFPFLLTLAFLLKLGSLLTLALLPLNRIPHQEGEEPKPQRQYEECAYPHFAVTKLDDPAAQQPDVNG
jgi:hypothetical protein